MSHSPFMTPDQSRRRRDAARARRRARRRVYAVGVLAIAIAATLVVMALAHSHPSHDASAAGTRHSTKSSVAAVTALSQTGLPLASPPLALSGIGTPAADPVQITFPEPPRAGLLFNLDTGQVLWQHDPHLRLRIASLTKMMTALLAVRSSTPDSPVLITREAVNTSGSKVGVLPLGKHVRMQTMLYGLLLPSGNDAAVAIAQHVGGTVNHFVIRMNEEAAKLGMGCTRYSSPSGYYNLGNYSCAIDLAELAHADLQEPRIASITRTYTAELPFPIQGGKLSLYNNNPLLIYHYPGLTGMKTGYTIEAGKCLVATATRDGVSLGVVLLHSPDPGTQASELLDHGFDDVYHQAPIAEPPIPPGV